VSEENIAVVRRLFDEVWSGGDLELIDELCSEDFVNHDPVMGEGDRQSAKQTVSTYRGAFPDLEIEVLDIFAVGDKVCARWRAQGTFENEIMGQQPTGERGEPVEGLSIDRFEDGKIAETWGQWDTLRFMRNIGAIPEQAAAPAS
jgi:predicted ester cyclase